MLVLSILALLFVGVITNKDMPLVGVITDKDLISTIIHLILVSENSYLNFIGKNQFNPSNQRAVPWYHTLQNHIEQIPGNNNTKRNHTKENPNKFKGHHFF